MSDFTVIWLLSQIKSKCCVVSSNWKINRQIVFMTLLYVQLNSNHKKERLENWENVSCYYLKRRINV